MSKQYMTTEENNLKARIEYLESEVKRLTADCLSAADVIKNRAEQITLLTADRDAWKKQAECNLAMIKESEEV